MPVFQSQICAVEHTACKTSRAAAAGSAFDGVELRRRTHFHAKAANACAAVRRAAATAPLLIKALLTSCSATDVAMEIPHTTGSGARRVFASAALRCERVATMAAPHGCRAAGVLRAVRCARVLRAQEKLPCRCSDAAREVRGGAQRSAVHGELRKGCPRLLLVLLGTAAARSARNRRRRHVRARQRRLLAAD